MSNLKDSINVMKRVRDKDHKFNMKMWQDSTVLFDNWNLCDTEQEAIDYAYSKGSLIVAAAGNDNSQTKFYPAGYNHVLAVANVDNFDKKQGS